MIKNNLLSVVMYHYVRDIKKSSYPGIKGLEVIDFIEQLKFFKKNYHIIKMEDILAYYSCGNNLPPKAVLLTFDDGYLDHYNNVYPILMEFGFQGSFYVPAKTVLEHNVLDVNKTHYILAACPNHDFLINEIKEAVFLYTKDFQLKSFDFYYTHFAKANRFDCGKVIFIKRMLQHALPKKLRTIMIDYLFNKWVSKDEALLSKELYMNKEQLIKMSTDGMHIGIHGYEHDWWDRLTLKQLENEIDKSISFLDILGIELEQWTACYPYGAFNQEVVEMLESKGCKLAFTTKVEQANLALNHYLKLPRFDTNDFPPISL